MPNAEMPGRSYLFAEFELRPAARSLFRNGRPVPLRSRGFDLLLTLVESAGRLVTKSELLELVWPGVAVAENNLTVQLSALRQALADGQGQGARLIATVSRRGYRFAAHVETVFWDTPALARPAGVRHNLPVALSTLIGRNAAVVSLRQALGQSRLMTVVGSGGIGKTALALAVGRNALPDFPDGVWLVELGPYVDQAMVPAAIAASLGLQVRPGDQFADIAAALRHQHALLILDNCEHLIADVAQAAETLLRVCPGLHILATSREPLRCEGEKLHRLLPLPVGPGLEQHSPAVALFMARAADAIDGFNPSRADQAAIAEICRRVDGIPLAIEMAAGRLRTLGLHVMRERLDDSLSLLVAGRRTALARQQTMLATLEWSYRLLDAADQVSLRSLAVFPASFCAEAAAAVIGCGPSDTGRVVDRLGGMLDRSFLSAELTGPEPRYALFDTTRQFLAAQAGPAEMRRARTVVNQWCVQRLTAAQSAWEVCDERSWVAKFAPDIHEVRAALLDTFAPEGDVATGVTLASLAAPLWDELTLAPEHERWVAEALLRITPATACQEQARLLLARTNWHTLADARPLHDALAAAHLFRMAGDLAGEAQALLAAAFARLSGPEELPEVWPHLISAQKLLARQAPGRSLAQYHRLAGIARWFGGEREQARVEFGKALSHCRASGLTGLYVRAAGSLAQRLCAEGAFAEAEATALEALGTHAGALEWSAPAIHLLGLLASYRLALDDHRGAAAAAFTSLARARACGLRHEFVWGVDRCAVAGMIAKPAQAAELLGFCDRTYQATTRRRFEHSVVRYQAALQHLARELGPARLHAAMLEGSGLGEQDAIERALDLAAIVGRGSLSAAS